MTHRSDAARGHDIVARWSSLAEQRLEHLTELFETGRWRRYHSERSFLENIQEAKIAVETWRGLVMREASLDNSTVDLSWLGRSSVALPLRDQTDWLHTQPASVPSPSRDVSIEAATERVCSDEAPSAPVIDNQAFHEPVLHEQVLSEQALDAASEPTLDFDAIEQRYPLLRNAL